MCAKTHTEAVKLFKRISIFVQDWFIIALRKCIIHLTTFRLPNIGQLDGTQFIIINYYTGSTIRKAFYNRLNIKDCKMLGHSSFKCVYEHEVRNCKAVNDLYQARTSVKFLFEK